MYVAPYTSLVNASMMGKSRLMKKMAWHIPLVYICARSEDSTGYPERTPHIIHWFDDGIAPHFGHKIDKKHLGRDKTYLFSTLKFSAFLLSLIKGLSALLGDETVVRQFKIRDCAAEGQYKWMWDDFAEPYDSGATQRILEECCYHCRRDNETDQYT